MLDVKFKIKKKKLKPRVQGLCASVSPNRASQRMLKSQNSPLRASKNCGTKRKVFKSKFLLLTIYILETELFNTSMTPVAKNMKTLKNLRKSSISR